MIRSLLFSLAAVLIAMGAPLITLSSTNSKKLDYQDLQVKEINSSLENPEDLTCPTEN